MNTILHLNFIHYFQHGIKKDSFLISFILVMICVHCNSAPVEIHTSYYSTILQRTAEYTLIAPSNYFEKKEAGHRYPVLYLLHCAGCDHHSFIESYHLTEFVDSFDMIIVMPYDGTSGGWWLDSPINTLSPLSTWLSGEFKKHIDSLYPTLQDRGHTGVAGHSMGGFGALHNLSQHPDIYGAAFSSKGLLDMVGHEGAYMASRVLGSFTDHPNNYHKVDLFENVDRFVGINAPIRFYSGPNEWFQHENRAFDSLLTQHNVPHDYFENDENHFPMSEESMHNMLKWFDSLFTQGKNQIRTTNTNVTPRRNNYSIRRVFVNGKRTFFTHRSGESFFHLNGSIANQYSDKLVSSGVLIGIVEK